MTNTNSLHAHVDYSARDCDGPRHRSYVLGMSDAEKASEFCDLTFKHGVLDAFVSVVPGGETTVKVTADGFEVVEPTEEGYVHVSVEWCEDELC